MDFKEIENILDIHFLHLQGSLEKESLPLLEAESRFFAGGENENINCLKGRRITAKEACELSAQGEIFVDVYKKPLISLVSVGDEWVSAFEEEYDDKERDRNSYMAAMLTNQAGAEVAGITLSKSNEQAVGLALAEALEKSNVVVMFGKNNEVNSQAVKNALEKYGDTGAVCIENQMLDLEKTQEERMKDYSGGSVVNIARDTHCCCHIKNNLILWLAGESDKIMSDFQAIVNPFVEKYYFG